MKLQNALLPLVAFALISAATVSADANWQQDTPKQNWHQYCETDGKLLDMPHGCFIAGNAFYERIDEVRSDFKGYRHFDDNAENFNFAMLYEEGSPAILKAGPYTIELTKGTKPNCPKGTITGPSGDTSWPQNYEFCGSSFWVLDPKLWT